jgi:hypothetical protein
VFRSAPDVTVSKDRLAETWETARTTLAPHLTAAREAVAPYVEEAGARMTPVIDEARARVAPAVETARNRLVTEVVPTVAAAVGTARDSSAPARAEAKERAAAALLALQGKKTKVRRWPTALLCLGAGAVAGAAAAKLGRKQGSPPPFPNTTVPTAHGDYTDATTPMSGPGTNPGS